MTVVINNQGRFDIDEVLEFVDIDASIASDDLDELLKSSAIRIVFGSCADGFDVGSTTSAARLRRPYSGCGTAGTRSVSMALSLASIPQISSEHAAMY